MRAVYKSSRDGKNWTQEEQGSERRVSTVWVLHFRNLVSVKSVFVECSVSHSVRGNCDGICRGLGFYSGFLGFFVQMPFSSSSHVFPVVLLLSSRGV